MTTKNTRQRFYLGVMFPVGLSIFLLASAILKLSGFGSSQSLLPEIPPQFQWLLIQLEMVLAVWLLIGWRMSVAWRFTLWLICAFVGANLVLLVRGRASCGCLGELQVHPALMLGVDLVLLLLLMFARPYWLSLSSNVQNSSELPNRNSINATVFGRKSLPVAISCFGLMVGILAVLYSGTFAQQITRFIPAKITGEYLALEPFEVEVGPNETGNWCSLKLQIVSRCEEPIEIIGAQRGCSCQAISGLPLAVQPGQTVELEMNVRMGHNPGLQRHEFWLMTSHPRQPFLLCRWKAKGVLPDRIHNDKLAMREQ